MCAGAIGYRSLRLAAITDGVDAVPLLPAADFKRVGEGDTGPNTGGMGAYSPAPVVTPEVEARIMHEVIEPTLKGMYIEGTPYLGFLYAGLMIMADGSPKVIEFNCRMGDPETQPILMRLKSDLVAICKATLEDTLDEVKAKWDERAALGVVMAAGGYPGSYARGKRIEGLDENFGEDQKVFHAGTALDGDDVVTAGGRVLCVVGLGDGGSVRRVRVHWPDGTNETWINLPVDRYSVLRRGETAGHGDVGAGTRGSESDLADVSGVAHVVDPQAHVHLPARGLVAAAGRVEEGDRSDQVGAQGGHPVPLARI